MKLAGNAGRGVGRAGSGGCARGTNQVVKFELLCDGARQSSHKVER